MSWFACPTGLRLLAEEQREAIPLLTQHIGVRGLYLRPAEAAPATLSGNMLQSVLNLHQQGVSLAGDLQAEVDCLPVENDSMCLVYALHTLDDCDDAGAVVDELQRVLRPDGVLFLFGLSPLSAWRARWMRQGIRARRAGRVRALLVDAGLSIEAQIGLGPIWPIPDGRNELPPLRPVDAAPLDALRAGYLLIARKRRTPLTPVGLRQARNANAMGAALQPQARVG